MLTIYSKNFITKETRIDTISLFGSTDDQGGFPTAKTKKK